MAFCDYCNCSDCVGGENWLSHARTVEGKWICDVCYDIELCVTAKALSGEFGDPCEKGCCEHRPKLVDNYWESYFEYKMSEVEYSYGH